MNLSWLKKIFININKLMLIGLLSSEINSQKLGLIQNAWAQNYEETEDLSAYNSKELFAQAKSIITDGYPGEERYAKMLLTEALRQNPNFIDALVELSRVTQASMAPEGDSSRNQFDELRKSISFALQAFYLDENSPKVRFRLSELYFELGKIDDSNILLKNTFDSFPNHPDTMIQKVKLFSDVNPQESISNARKLIELNVPISEYLDGYLAASKKLLGPTHYIKELEYADQKTSDRWLTHRMGMYYLENEKFDQAVKYFKKAIEQGNKIESRLQLGVTLYSKLSRYDESLKIFDDLIDEIKKRKYIGSQSFYLVKSHIVITHLKKGDTDATKRSLLNLAVEQPQNQDYLKAVIYEFEKSKQLPLMESSMLVIQQNEPGFILSYKTLREIYKQEKKYEKALIMADDTITLVPNDPDLLVSRGHIYYLTKDYLNALADFERALVLDPTNASTLYNIACMNSMLNRNHEALGYLKEAIEKDKSLSDQARNDSDFINLKSDKTSSEKFIELVGR